MCVSGPASPANLATGTRGPLTPHGCGGRTRKQPGRGAGDGSACSPSTQNKGAKGTHLSGHPPGSLTSGQPTEQEPEGGPASQGVATPPTHLTPPRCQPQERSCVAPGAPVPMDSPPPPAPLPTCPLPLPGTAGPGWEPAHPHLPWRGSAASSQHPPLLPGSRASVTLGVNLATAHCW